MSQQYNLPHLSEYLAIGITMPCHFSIQHDAKVNVKVNSGKGKESAGLLVCYARAEELFDGMMRRLEGNCSLLAPGVVAPKMGCDGELKRRGRWWRERGGEVQGRRVRFYY